MSGFQDEVIFLEGSLFRRAKNEEEFNKLCEIYPLVVLPGTINQWFETLRHLSEFFKAHDGTAFKITHAYLDIICQHCSRRMPSSYQFLIMNPNLRMSIIGAPANIFDASKEQVCPWCGSHEAWFVFDNWSPNEVTIEDLAILKSYWAHLAQLWRKSTGRIGKEGCCDACSRTMAPDDQRFLSGGNMLCEPCCNERLSQDVLKDLKNDPHWFGRGEFRCARAWAAGNWVPRIEV